MKKLLFLLSFAVLPLFAGSDFDSFKMADQRKFIIGCGFEDPDFPHLVVRPAVRSECTFTRNAGVNGNTGLVIERKKTPADRTIYSVLNRIIVCQCVYVVSSLLNKLIKMHLAIRRIMTQ